MSFYKIITIVNFCSEKVTHAQVMKEKGHEKKIKYI